MKLTYEQKLKAYEEWKKGLKSPYVLAKELNLQPAGIKYFLRLADLHGTDALKHGKSRYYCPEEKARIINRVLIGGESVFSVEISEGISGHGLLQNWIRSYRENGYNVIERKRGRRRNGKESKEPGGASPGDQRPEGEEPETRNRERIHKKMGCLGSGKGRAGKEEIAQAVSGLRQELGCPLGFILDTIKADPSLPQITRSDYYYQMGRTDRDWKNDALMNRIIGIYYGHKGRYGYRRIVLELRNQGIVANGKKVRRLMRRMGLEGIAPKVKYRSYKGDLNGTVKSKLLVKETDPETGKEILKRDFSTTAPNEKWTTDVSEFHIAAGKLYLSPILDMFNGEIVSYAISRSPNYAQIQMMLDGAFGKYPDLEGLIFHSDQGWQYQMAQYHTALKDKGIIQSMSRKGNCLDNCVMENFFGRMKNEMFYGHEHEFASLDQLEVAMEEYIDYYNTERIQAKLKGLTPCQARQQALESR